MKLHDRRTATRIPRELECTIYDIHAGKEYLATIVDISESGLKFKIPLADLNLSIEGLAVQFVDDLSWNNTSHIIQEEITPIRFEKDCGNLVVGAKFNNRTSMKKHRYMQDLEIQAVYGTALKRRMKRIT